jgi:Flp pilus assembly pilin Flp
MHSLRYFWRDESGQTVIEYVVIVVLILVAAFALIRGVGGEVTRLLELIRTTLAGAGT